MEAGHLSILKKYFPSDAVEEVFAAIRASRVHLRFSKARSSKLGDYRPALNGKPHRISLNHNMNPYEMLITWVHELAHLHAFERYGRKHQPHGPEWKSLFGSLMRPFLNRHIFPDEIETELQKYLYQSGAANGSDLQLRRLLQHYDPHTHNTGKAIEKLPLNAYFQLPDGRVFRKMEQSRKRFKCLCMNDNRFYLFSPLAVVLPLEEDNSNQSLYLTKKSI